MRARAGAPARAPHRASARSASPTRSSPHTSTSCATRRPARALRGAADGAARTFCAAPSSGSAARAQRAAYACRVRRGTLAAVVALAAGLGAAPARADAAPPRADPAPAGITVAASGDFLVHQPVWQRARVYGHGRRYDFRPMFRRIRPLIAGADLALCHVETPFSYGPPRGYPSFRTPPALAAAIKASGWDACSTASNHTLDHGQRGVNTPLRVLERAGLRHAGSHRSRAGARRPTILTVKGVKIGYLAYTALTNGQRVPHAWSLDMARAGRILSDARRARRAGAEAVIVNIHWGDEFQSRPSAAQRTLARRLTRSPAITAVVGQHVHVVQPIR